MTEIDGALELVYESDELAELDPAERRLALRSLVCDAGGDVSNLVRELADHIDGYGPLSALMADDEVTDVLINRPDEIWVERNGNLERTSVGFSDRDALRDFVEHMLGRALPPARVDASQPVVDARLPDGSRFHVVVPPLAPDGPLVSIRRFPKSRLTLHELADRGMLSHDQSQLLSASVVARRNIAISGGTGSGKTTLLNALLNEVPPSQRVVVVEETPELGLARAHAVSLVARAENVARVGAIDLVALVRAALRMRPDRIVVGEVRGAEALAAITAMSTGHAGSLLTVHARSASEVIQRLLSLALAARSGASEISLRAQVEGAIEVIAHLERDGLGRRRVAALDVR